MGSSSFSMEKNMEGVSSLKALFSCRLGPSQPAGSEIAHISLLRGEKNVTSRPEKKYLDGSIGLETAICLCIFLPRSTIYRGKRKFHFQKSFKWAQSCKTRCFIVIYGGGRPGRYKKCKLPGNF